eukprot:5666345-Ditylum_brightwellii.AAC.1
MDLPIGIRCLVAVQHTPTCLWYPAIIITEGSDYAGSFYHIVWLECLIDVQNSEAYVYDGHVQYFYLKYLFMSQ